MLAAHDRLAMRPLPELAAGRRRAIRYLMTDIDDTLTTDGRLTAGAYAALERLSDVGVAVVPVTGRPAGWCDMIARFWPVEAVIGENGAFWFRYLRREHRMERRYWDDEATRQANRARLDALAMRILADVPGSAIAADQAYRIADLAIDFREDVAPLPNSAVDRILDHFRAAGAVAKVSSIHVNGWFGAYDKLAMARRLCAEAFDRDLTRCGDEVAFIGDSPNDEPMFAALDLSVAVANIRDFADRIETPPAFVTQRRGGAGFAEFADAIIGAAKQQT